MGSHLGILFTHTNCHFEGAAMKVEKDNTEKRQKRQKQKLKRSTKGPH